MSDVPMNDSIWIARLHGESGEVVSEVILHDRSGVDAALTATASWTVTEYHPAEHCKRFYDAAINLLQRVMQPTGDRDQRVAKAGREFDALIVELYGNPEGALKR